MNRNKKSNLQFAGRERGAILVLVAITFTVFLGFVAIAIDMNHLYVVRNELQNAADAGALAGAKALYEDADGAGPLLPGEKINVAANVEAREAGIENRSERFPVEITVDTSIACPATPYDLSGDTVDVRRGHWSFTNKRFTCIEDTTDPVELWGVPTEELDKMDGTHLYNGGYPKHVNAVRVVARRDDIEAESFFAKIYGFLGFKMRAEAVAYIGYAGSLGPLEADVPIAICDTSLSNGDCNIGRMINSADKETSNTAAWIDASNPLSSEAECSGGTNAQILGDQIGDIGTDTTENNTACECISPTHDPAEECGVNNQQITGSTWLEAIGGQVSSGYNPMQECYDNFLPGEPWEMTLPVVKCDGGQVEGCLDVVSAVTVNMVFMAKGNNPTQADTPYEMTKPEAENFPDWHANQDCSFFYQLAGVDSNENEIINPATGDVYSFYNAALLDSPVYGSTALPNNLQKYTLPYLPETDFVKDADGNFDYVVDGSDPWSIGDRWDGVSSTNKAYTADMARWDCFAYHFNLVHQNANFAPFQAKALYFMPDCEYHEPKGTTSDENFGVLAEHPVLVH